MRLSAKRLTLPGGAAAPLRTLTRCSLLAILAGVTLGGNGIRADEAAGDWREGLRLSGFADNELRGELLRGEPVLLQFWASWCHSCGALMSDLDEISGRFPSVRYLAVSIDEKAGDASRRLARHPLYATHPERFFHDRHQQLANRFDVATVPTVLVIAPDGRELSRQTGHLNSSDLNRIASHLADLDAHAARRLP